MDIVSILGDEEQSLLAHQCEGINREALQLPGPDFIEHTLVVGDRGAQVLRNFQALFNHGRLGGTRYLSLLPVDQGVEHTAGALLFYGAGRDD